jgi:pimeloyl-ACP methyl ester carboxylesterase
MSRSSASDIEAERFDVRSADGTSLAVWVEGDGPPLVLVHGAMQDHTGSALLVEALRDDVTTFAMDRRGRGASAEGTGDYSIEREFADIAAAVDAVAARAGRPVAVWGHSYGANCAMGAATLTGNVDRLVVYEPGLGYAYPAGSIDAVEDAVAAGDMDAAADALLFGILEMTEEEVDVLRSSPVWPSRLACVPTVPRELRAEDGWVYEPGQFGGITAPTLVLAGSKSLPAQDELTRRAASAIPDSRIQVLEGHGHFAHREDPDLVAGIIREFLGS